MNARRECEVAVRLAGDVEDLGGRELRGIAIGRSDTDRNLSSGGKHLVAHAEIGRRDPVSQLVGAFEPQHLLNRGLDQVRMIQETPALVRPLNQQLKAVPDEIGRGFVARIEDENAVVQQLRLA